MASAIQENYANKALLACIYSPESQRIGNQKITLSENHDWKTGSSPEAAIHYHSLTASCLRVLRSSEGIYRLGKLADVVPKFVNAVREAGGMSRLDPLDQCSLKSGAAAGWLTAVPSAVTLTADLVDEVQGAAKTVIDQSVSIDMKRQKVQKLAASVAEATAFWAFSVANTASLFSGGSKIGCAALRVADYSGYAGDALGLAMNVENYAKVSAIDLTHATPEIKITVESTKKEIMLSAMKTVCSIAATCFAMLQTVTGVGMMPPVFFVGMSLASTVLGVARKLYIESLMFKPVNFFDGKSIVHVTA